MHLTQDCNSVPIAKAVAVERSNEWWRERAIGELNALLEQANGKRRFFGRTTIEVIFQDSRIIGIDADLKQQVRT